MVQISSGVLGAVAATLAFGAVHLEVASGNDLLGPRGLVPAQGSFQDASQIVQDPIAASVNRSAKSDRAGAPAPSDSMTLSFSLAGVPDTSVIMRVPMKSAVLPRQPIDDPQASNTVKNTTKNTSRMVACEPSVSILTQAARQLQAVRCVT